MKAYIAVKEYLEEVYEQGQYDQDVKSEVLLKCCRSKPPQAAKVSSNTANGEAFNDELVELFESADKMINTSNDPTEVCYMQGACNRVLDVHVQSLPSSTPTLRSCFFLLFHLRGARSTRSGQVTTRTAHGSRLTLQLNTACLPNNVALDRTNMLGR